MSSTSTHVLGAQTSCPPPAPAAASDDRGHSEAAFRPVIIAPTFQNAATLPDVLSRLQCLEIPILVVNDGSTDDTARVLRDWLSNSHRPTDEVLTHPRNRGKGAALRTAFAHARKKGFSHAVTIDTDGQLDPEQVPQLLERACGFPAALILGSRDPAATGCPASNRLGWWMSALGLFLETGLRLPDSQCGLRVYPLDLLPVISCRARRFGFEAEVLARAAWAGCPIVQVPVTCHYPAEEKRVSHFRPWRDGVKIFLMHAVLTLRRLIPLPHARYRSPSRPSPGPSAVGRSQTAKTWHQRFRERLSPLRLWRQLRRDRFEQLLVASGFGIGTFMANVPLGGLQVLLATYVAVRLHIHWLPPLAASLLCLTPLGSALLQLGFNLGHLLFYARLPEVALAPVGTVEHLLLLARHPIAWPVGGVIVGFFCNWITIALLVRFFRLVPVRSDEVQPHSGCLEDA